MFKIAGMICVLFSTTLISLIDVIKSYCTAKFLDETMMLIKQINIENYGNYSYSEIFKKINLADTGFYKDFDFLNRESFCNNIQDNMLIYQEDKSYVCNFITEIGKKNKQSEQIYLQYIMSTISDRYNVCKTKFNETKKIRALYGFATGILILIIII